MRNSHLVTYSVTNAEVTVNKAASEAKDILLDIRGNIVKGNVTLKGHRLVIPFGVAKRGGFSFEQNDETRTATITVTEFDKGRTVKQGASAKDNASALKSLGL